MTKMHSQIATRRWILQSEAIVLKRHTKYATPNRSMSIDHYSEATESLKRIAKMHSLIAMCHWVLQSEAMKCLKGTLN
jgi:hypothetical protein